jgi:2-polyprenyl-3-methyl-5-hydroxy-6-metoxy-1,4-benzoquinol methylase
MKADIISLVEEYPGWLPKIFIFLRWILLPFSSIEPFIPKKGKIYDVGCGFGSHTIHFALSNKNRRLIGLDLNKKRIEMANRVSVQIPNVEFKSQDLTKSTKLTNADSILLLDILHHIPITTQKKLLKECYYKLKPGGILVMKDVSERPLWKYIYNVIHDKIMTFNDPLFFIRRKQMRILLMNAKFKIVYGPKQLKTWPMNPIPHYIIIAKKNNC